MNELILKKKYGWKPPEGPQPVSNDFHAESIKKESEDSKKDE